MVADSLGDRMKRYEDAWRATLPERLPVIVRVDGRAFHSMPFEKPFDAAVEVAMSAVVEALCDDAQGAVLAYAQSDEASVMLWPWWRHESQAWFSNNLQKIASMSASVATRAWCDSYQRPACFDARAFVLPPDEACNYFIWRQQDWERNSVQMLARAHFSQKQLNGKTRPDMLAMLAEIGVSWDALGARQRLGLVWRHGAFFEGPRFVGDRDFVAQAFVKPEPAVAVGA